MAKTKKKYALNVLQAHAFFSPGFNHCTPPSGVSRGYSDGIIDGLGLGLGLG